tara:strand:+ start:724 stop:1299 length:576 start_codon:yes stop_codon:yes gene_type:complete
MANVFDAPIPGQSLTDEPKNYPWERPPEIVDPRQAVKFHLEGLNNPDSLDNIIELIQLGVPVSALAKTAVTTAQMEGIHSVDVGLLIGDIIKEELITIAEEAGVDYVSGDEPDEVEVKTKEDQMTMALLRKKLDAIEPGSTEDDSGVDFMRATAETLETGIEEGAEAPMMEQEEPPMMEAPDAPRGLMARG